MFLDRTTAERIFNF
jgi:hypothetical protein